MLRYKGAPSFGFGGEYKRFVYCIPDEESHIAYVSINWTLLQQENESPTSLGPQGDRPFRGRARQRVLLLYLYRMSSLQTSKPNLGSLPTARAPSQVTARMPRRPALRPCCFTMVLSVQTCTAVLYEHYRCCTRSSSSLLIP